MGFHGKCEVCGGTTFHEVSGFFYCAECNTQQQTRMEMDMDVFDMTMGDAKIKVRGVKLKDTKAEKVQLTSWEEYNYILMGLVEEAINLGAKPQLKRTVFQIWARYLQKTQAAFFSKTNPDLPKLPINYHRKDASIIYNKIAKRRRSTSTCSTKSTISKAKSLRRRRVLQIARTKTRNALMKEQFELFSTGQSKMSEKTAGSSTSQSQSGVTSAKSNIPLEFTRSARRMLKKRMPKAHIIKHATDFESTLKCHSKRKQPNELEQTLEALSQNIVLCILYLGLNQTQSDIQIGDMIRFAREGHLSTFNVDHFFPENVLQNMKRSSYVNFNGQNFLPSHRNLRKMTVKMCDLLGMKDLQLPDFVKLVERYVQELCLPRECVKYLERLIMFHPPKMNYWHFKIPCYEGRAMAYILFILKWLFTVDGHTEEILSQGAAQINEVIQENKISHLAIFNFDEWMKYIEMRNVILSEYHMPTNLAMENDKGSTNTQRYLEFLDHVKRPPFPGKKILLGQIQEIYQTLHTIHGMSSSDEKPEKKKSFMFKPSLTPSKSYLEDIMENHLNEVALPNFLLIDHSERTLDPFLRPNKFQNFMARQNIVLNVQEAEGSKEWETVDKTLKLQRNQLPLVKINIVETEAEVDIEIPPKRRPVFVGYRTCGSHAFKGKGKLIKGKKRKEIKEEEYEDSIVASNLLSNDILPEESMDPGESVISKPRRILENMTMFDDMSDEDEEPSLEPQEKRFKTDLNFFTPHFNYWHHFLQHNLSQFFDLTDDDFHEVLFKLPRSFRWLLRQCSTITNIDEKDIYCELLIIEKEFTCTLDSVDNMTTRVLLREHEPRYVPPSSKFLGGIW